MIKIVVRHHHHHHSHRHHDRSQEAPTQHQNQQHNTSNRKRLNQEAEGDKASSGKRQSTSSCVEIKYSKMLASSSATAPKAPLRSGQKSVPVAVKRQRIPISSKSVQQRPRGSLSSCSSSSPELSGNEEIECHSSFHPEEPRSLFNYSLSVFDESSADELDERAPPTDLNNNHHTQETVRVEPVAVAPVGTPATHHARSISLMVNPDFESSSSAAEESEPTSQAAPVGSVKYKRGRNRFHYRQTSHCPVMKKEFKEADYLRLKQLKEELEASKLTEAESSRLREIGFFLRQISDEFALDRRLTI